MFLLELVDVIAGVKLFNLLILMILYFSLVSM
jgi:hypothetical protein